ncbi:MAG: hypothetical protein ACT4TC_22040 [Myxococcaceae bacterium]
MNLKTLIALCLGLAQLATGCIVVGGGGNGGYSSASPGDVTFTWSFVGDTCADHPEIKSIIVDIPGEALQNDGYYPCTANNYPGIVLHNFAGGPYDYNLTAVGYGNETLFTAGGRFVVDGNVRVTVDMMPPGSGSSFAYVAWNFPANSEQNAPNCAQAGVAFVDVSIDGAAATRYNCTAGFGTQGVRTPLLAAGSHTVEMIAVSADEYPYYRFTGGLTTFSNNPIFAEYDLDWAVGGAAIRWHLTDGAVGESCYSSGVNTVYINFKDTNGNWVYGTNGDAQSCDGAPIVYNYLLPGVYRVYVQANGFGGAVYRSNQLNPPTITVNEGDFVDEQMAVTVNVYRQ